jgi:hypothetical protein
MPELIANITTTITSVAWGSIRLRGLLLGTTVTKVIGLLILGGHHLPVS